MSGTPPQDVPRQREGYTMIAAEVHPDLVEWIGRNKPEGKTLAQACGDFMQRGVDCKRRHKDK